MSQYVYLKLGYDADKLTKERAIDMLNEWGAAYSGLLSLEEVEGVNEGIKKIHNESAKHLNAVVEAVEETGWFLPDGVEVLCEINSQGFSYPESINILKEVLNTVNLDYRLDWRLELTKIVAKRKPPMQEYENRENFKRALHQGLGIGKKAEETKESFCCSRMAQAVKGKIFTPIHYDTDLTKIEYYSFSFRVDSKLSVCAIIHYCPFCGKKIGVKETKREEDNEKIKCPKCGSEMRYYQVQTQSRVGYRFDIELQAFQCTNLRCTYTKNIKKEVLPTNALYIKEGDGSFIRIR